MKSLSEKEKKLQEALNKLIDFEFTNKDNNSKIDFLNEKKNQLEIEKKELENKYEKLQLEFNQLKLKIEQLDKQHKNET